jgi:PadR family transcriptional regulator, regulatory protein AphA
MPRENKSKYALLGLLTLRPMSGYDIKKTIEVSLGNFWSESYGQIYPILKALVAEGLATITVETQAGKPNRNVYALTQAGHEEFERWLHRPSEYDVGRNEILLKLFFGWHAPAVESLHKVEEFREVQRQLLDKYEGIEQWLKETEADDPRLPYWLMTVSYGKHVGRALTAWCDETLTALQEMAEATETPDRNRLKNSDRASLNEQ